MLRDDAGTATWPASDAVQRLTEISQDVVDMFDADAEADHFRRHAGAALLLGRKLAMGGGGGVRGERLRIAEIDQALEQPQGIEKAPPRLEAAMNAEGQQRAVPPSEVFVGEGVIGIVGKSRIAHPGDF